MSRSVSRNRGAIRESNPESSEQDLSVLTLPQAASSYKI